MISTFDNIDDIENTYIVVKREKGKIKYVKNIERIIIKSFSEISETVFIESLKNYKYTLLHGMNMETLELIEKSRTYESFVWFSWGMDIYNVHNKLRENLMLSKTRRLYNSIYNQYYIKRLLKKIIATFDNNQFYKRQQRVLKKIKYIAPVIREDYEVVKKYYKNAEHLRYLDFTYGDIRSFSYDDFEIKGENILLGNSGTFSNNHIEIVDILFLNKYKGEIFVPLSYGVEKYIDSIENYGHNKFGEKFNPLRTFLSIDEYLKMLSSVGFVIMNHKRQQGMGNIYAMLYGGCKLFLREENPVYNFLIRNNFNIFTIDELESNTAFSPITEYQKRENREIIKTLLLPDIVLDRANLLVKTLIEN